MTNEAKTPETTADLAAPVDADVIRLGGFDAVEFAHACRLLRQASVSAEEAMRGFTDAIKRLRDAGVDV